jgi:RNA polymerase sigma factor (sigma-70 family)
MHKLALGEHRMDNNGLEAVFMASRPALERFLRARCGSATEAEDLLQDMWLKLPAASGPVSEPLAYLYRMADNLVLDRRRSAARRERRDDAWSDLSVGGNGGASDVPSVDRTLIAKEQLAIVETALTNLGERTFSIFRRFRIDGVAQRDIANEYGISLSAVEKHLQKAYNAVLRLRENIDADLAQPERLDHIEGNRQPDA